MKSTAARAVNYGYESYRGHHEDLFKKYLSTQPDKQQVLYLKLSANRGCLKTLAQLRKDGNIEVVDLETREVFRSLSAFRGKYRSRGAGSNSWKGFQNNIGVPIGDLIGA